MVIFFSKVYCFLDNSNHKNDHSIIEVPHKSQQSFDQNTHVPYLLKGILQKQGSDPFNNENHV